ncbi:hypothetical protein [Castellaniella sp.]|uniref:hypothetical protein n=1 Tax=Castellaniella sp. TaxID=1955812 RepID=UPI003C7623F4
MASVSTSVAGSALGRKIGLTVLWTPLALMGFELFLIIAPIILAEAVRFELTNGCPLPVFK